MPEIFRTRDVVVFGLGIAYPVAINGPLTQNGWAGGQGLSWVDSSLDEFRVGFSDGGRGAGFALWGSNEDSDQLTALTGYQVAYGHLIMGSGSWLLATSTYEQYTYASRLAGPLVPITYTAKEKLYWSLRGLFTNEDEWTLSGDPRAPNVDPVAFVVQIPSALTESYITVQTTL